MSDSPMPSPPSAPPAKPIWKRWWVWVGALVIVGIAASVVSPSDDTSNDEAAAPSETESGGQVLLTPVPGVSSLPVFDGQDGGRVVALVNRSGLVSAKVLGELPTTCAVSAGDIVAWDKASATYKDTGTVAVDLAGEPASSLMATFSGPVGTGDSSGYVFHADMDLKPPYPKAIIVALACTY